MAGKKHVYYTFKVIAGDPIANPLGADLVVACHKWDELEGSDELPVETYKVAPNNRSVVGGCSCPAWKWDCKHVKAVLEAIELGYIYEFHRWRWGEKTGWVEVTEFDKEGGWE